MGFQIYCLFLIFYFLLNFVSEWIFGFALPLRLYSVVSVEIVLRVFEFSRSFCCSSSQSLSIPQWFISLFPFPSNLIPRRQLFFDFAFIPLWLDLRCQLRFCIVSNCRYASWIFWWLRFSTCECLINLNFQFSWWNLVQWCSISIHLYPYCDDLWSFQSLWRFSWSSDLCWCRLQVLIANW